VCLLHCSRFDARFGWPTRDVKAPADHQQTPVPVTQIDFKKPAKARAVVVDPWFPARAVSRLSCRFRPIRRDPHSHRCGDSRRARCGFGSCPPGVHLRRPSTLLSVSTPVAFSSHRRFRDRGLLISKPNLALLYHPVVAINAAADSVLGVAPGHWQQPHNQMLAPRYHRAGATNSRGHHGLPHPEAMVRHGGHMVSFGLSINRLRCRVAAGNTHAASASDRRRRKTNQPVG
jgi:hypothetical protein